MSWEPYKPKWAKKDKIARQIWKGQATWRVRSLIRDFLFVMPYSWQLGVITLPDLTVLRIGPFGIMLRGRR
jgi:hypothetical protein